MKTNVYNIVWADDEIDNLLDDDTRLDLLQMGFKVIGCAHDGEEFEKILEEHSHNVDAVILDANFNESCQDAYNERDTSGLEHSWSVLTIRYGRKIPFFLYTNRSDEFIKESFKYRKHFTTDFPRHKRWFSKSGEGEFYDMLNEIKRAVDEKNSPEFIICNRYHDELAAADLLGKRNKDFIFKFLLCDYTNTLADLKEPFKSARDVIENIFKECENQQLIPKISKNTNGTAYYFLNNKYGEKCEPGSNCHKDLYEACDGGIMPKPVAQLLVSITHIVQDAAHNKKDLKLKVYEYYNEHHDFNLLRSVMYSLIGVVKWYADAVTKYCSTDMDERPLWKEIKE